MREDKSDEGVEVGRWGWASSGNIDASNPVTLAFLFSPSVPDTAHTRLTALLPCSPARS